MQKHIVASGDPTVVSIDEHGVTQATPTVQMDMPEENLPWFIAAHPAWVVHVFDRCPPDCPAQLANGE